MLAGRHGSVFRFIVRSQLVFNIGVVMGHQDRLPECVDDKKKWDQDHDNLVTLKAHFEPVKMIVYGFTTIALTAIAIAIISIVVRK